MHRRRWVYLMIIVVGAVLALGIAGVPSTKQDTPVRSVTTSTTVGGLPNGAG